MSKRVMAISMVILLAAGVAWAAQRAGKGDPNRQWWPGEGPGARPGNVATGTVTQVDAQSITLGTKQGPATFAVTDKTKVMVQGKPAKITDVNEGDLAAVRFAVAADGSRTALVVRVPKPQFAGKITAISGNGFTLTGREHTWNVTITSETKIISQGYVGTPADLRVGYWAVVGGDAQGDTVQAKVVRFRPTVIKGVVQSVNGYEITFKTIKQRIVKVTASDATVVWVRPRTAPNRKGTLADVKPNTAANIGGHITGQNTMDALWIDLLVAGTQQPATQRAPRPALRRLR